MPKVTQKSLKPPPKGKSQGRRAPSDLDDDDDDDEVGYTPSQNRHTVPPRSSNKHPPASTQEEEEKANILVRYLLIMDQKKHPIKKIDIKKHVLKEHGREFDTIMDRAKMKMRQVFGIEVVEIDPKTKSYILRNALAADINSQVNPCEPLDHAKRGLLTLVLSLIFMNDNEIQESVMWYALAKMGLFPDRTSDVFGDVKRLLTVEFVRQGYLEYIRRPQYDPPVHDLRWGARAKHEVTKSDILDFVCEVHGDGVKPDDWKAQYQDVKT